MVHIINCCYTGASLNFLLYGYELDVMIRNDLDIIRVLGLVLYAYTLYNTCYIFICV